jgi:hypothetical protein
MASKQNRILHALSNSGCLFVEPGFLVEQRTIFGIHGDETDLAISLQWRDTTGCKWEADFTEESLMNAHVKHNRVMLKDSEGSNVCVEMHRLRPMKV